MRLLNKHRFVGRDITWPTMVFMILVTLQFGALYSQTAHAYTIGIIVGKNKNRTSTSNHEKMCILKNVTDNFSRSARNVNFEFVQNDRSAIGSANAALELVSKEVDLALLPLVSHEAAVAADVLTSSGIPFVTTATATSVIKPGNDGLSIMPSNLQQAKLLAQLYADKHKGKKLHVITNQSKEYSKSLSKSFIKAVVSKLPDVEILEHHYSNVHAPAIARSIGAGEVVFASLYNPNIAVLYSYLAKENRKISVIGPDSIGGRKEFFSIIGQTSDLVDLKFLRNWDHQLKGVNSKAITPYVKTYCYEKKSTFLTTYSYDLINFVLSQVDKIPEGATGSEVIEILKKSEYQTVMDGKSMTFDSNGYNKKNMYLYEARGESIHLVSALGDGM